MLRGLTSDALRATIEKQGVAKWVEIVDSADYTAEAKAIAQELLSAVPDSADWAREKVAAPGPSPEPNACQDRARPTRRPLRGLFAVCFLGMATVLLWSFFSSSMSTFWYEKCSTLGIGAALIFLALFVWGRELWAAHLVTLTMAVAVVGLVGGYHETGRSNAVLPTMLGFVAGVFLWYFILIPKSRDKKISH